MYSLLTLILMVAELLANHVAAKAISSVRLHTGPGSQFLADRAHLAAIATTQHKHLRERAVIMREAWVIVQTVCNNHYFFRNV